MSKELFALLSAVFVILLFAAGWWGWRSRGKRQRDIVPFEQADQFEATIDAPILYVATTRAGDPYERITAHEMGFRARGRIAIGTAGVLLDLPATTVLIPADDITAIERATWTIDRVVEPKGLIRITWNHSGVPLDANIRVTDDDTAVFAALRALVPVSTPPIDALANTEGTDA